MSRARLWIAALCGAALCLPPAALAAEPTLDQVLAGYAKARGGEAAWQKVQSLTMSGSFSSFSHRKPFTFNAMRPGYYYFESESLRGRMVHAVDADGPWWIMPAIGEPLWSKRIQPPHKPLIARAGLFEPPLLGAVAKGHAVKLLGAGDIDGMPTVDLEVTLATGEKEIWHLDPKTYLEVAIDATTFDFTQSGGPIAERTYFEDFRTAGGIVLPYRVQKEYLARYTLLEVQDVAINPPLEAATFTFQLPAGMERLRGFRGDYAVKFEVPGRPNTPWQVFQGTAKIDSRLDGAVLDETSEINFGGSVVRQERRWAFDRFDQIFRIVQLDDNAFQPSVYVGKVEAEAIQVDNLGTQSGSVDESGTETFDRFTVRDLGAEGIKFEGEQSSDGGKTWTAAWRATYTRPVPEPAAGEAAKK